MVCEHRGRPVSIFPNIQSLHAELEGMSASNNGEHYD